MSFQYRFSFIHSLFFSFSFFFAFLARQRQQVSLNENAKKGKNEASLWYVIDQTCGQIFAKSVFFSIFVHFEYWLTERKSSSIKTAACVTSVFVWFWIKESPGNGIFGFGRARKETRAILHRPLRPLPAVLLTPFFPQPFPWTARKLNPCYVGYKNMRTEADIYASLTRR